MGGGDDFRVICESKVVVGTEIQHLGGVSIGLHVDGSLLRSGDQTFCLEQAFGVQGIGLRRKRVEEFSRHGIALEG